MFAATGATIVSVQWPKSQAFELHDLRSRVRSFSLPYRRFLALGGMACQHGLQGLCRINRRSRFWWIWRPRMRPCSRPRKGKYTENGIKPIPAHSFPLAAIGVFLLMLVGTGLTEDQYSLLIPAMSLSLFTTTTIAAGCGSWCNTGIMGTLEKARSFNGSQRHFGWFGRDYRQRRYRNDLRFHFDRRYCRRTFSWFHHLLGQSKDRRYPVGAISVHGVCGIWGTLACAIFGDSDFMVQLIGAVSVSVFAFVFALRVFAAIKATIGVRVSEEEEERGLDISEHGQGSIHS